MTDFMAEAMRKVQDRIAATLAAQVDKQMTDLFVGYSEPSPQQDRREDLYRFVTEERPAQPQKAPWSHHIFQDASTSPEDVTFTVIDLEPDEYHYSDQKELPSG